MTFTNVVHQKLFFLNGIETCSHQVIPTRDHPPVWNMTWKRKKALPTTVTGRWRWREGLWHGRARGRYCGAWFCCKSPGGDGKNVTKTSWRLRTVFALRMVQPLESSRSPRTSSLRPPGSSMITKAWSTEQTTPGGGSIAGSQARGHRGRSRGRGRLLPLPKAEKT